MDKILAEYADHAYETARLGRNDVHRPRDLVSAEMLVELEAAGDAMRYVNSRGRIAWKATPQLRDYLMDLQLDAEADLAGFLTMLGREPTTDSFFNRSDEGQSAATAKRVGNGIRPARDRDAIYRLSEPPFSKPSWRGRRRVGPSTVPIGRCTCEGTIRSGSRNRSRPSFIARPIMTRSMTGRGANGRGCLRYAAEYQGPR